MNHIFRMLVASVVIMSLGSCDKDVENTISTNRGGILQATCTDMLPQFFDPTSEIKTRAGSSKTKEEQEIRTLHLFFFNEKGEFLTGNKLQPYMKISNSVLPIPEDAFAEGTDLTKVKIYAIANIFGDRFQTSVTEGGDIRTAIAKGEAARGTADFIVRNAGDLEAWIYAPEPRTNATDVSHLPAPGMPMSGQTTVDLSNRTKPIEIQLTAMMARVEINIKLVPNHFNATHTLPTLTITEYGIKNMPTAVPFTAPQEREGTPSANTEDAYAAYYNDYCSKTDYNYGLLPMSVPVQMETIDGNNEAGVSFSYYTYENVQYPKIGKSEYPAGVTDVDKQRWKPTLAKTQEASALTLRGTYVTYNGDYYDAYFSVYMGENNTNNFQVRRNRRYVNNIEIKGLTNIRNDDEEVYTFDGRVNVTAANPVFISIVNERRVDAHATCLPMDVYFLLRENGVADAEDRKINSIVSVELMPDESGKIPDWIRMEKITRAQMEKPAIDGQILPDGNTDTRAPFSAGKMARLYFTDDLVTKTLKDSTKVLIANRAVYEGNDPAYAGVTGDTRSRVYFYIDENVPAEAGAEVPDRYAKVKITYISDSDDVDMQKREFEIEIKQAGLLRVQAKRNERTIDFYIEQYEEYMDHNDPLDKHSMPAEMYSGLPWSKRSDGGDTYATDSEYRKYIGRSSSTGQRYRSYNIYGEKDGYWMTDFMMNGRVGRRPISEVKIYNDAIPPTAFHYCYGKNKRNADGSVSTANKKGYWFLPGITDLEIAMETYYTNFAEFQNNFYWSASSAKHKRLVAIEELTSHARATKTDDNGAHVESGDGDANANPGRKPRTEALRIRAGYIFIE